MKNQAALLLIAISLLCAPVFAQSGGNSSLFSKPQQTSIGLHRTINLESDSKTADISINIKPGEGELNLSINTEVSQGKLTIEVYDPTDTKQGSFTVGTQLNSEKRELVRGNIQKSLTEPLAGTWKVKIIPSEATGRVEIKTITSE